MYKLPVKIVAGLAVIAACIVPRPAWSQGTIMPVPHQVFLSNAGAPLVNSKICLYAAGTTTPLAAYSNEALTVELPNPIRTNSAGRPQTAAGTETNVYWSAASYRIDVLTAGSDATCSTGTTIYSADNVPAIPALASALDVTGTAGATILAGEVVYLSDGSASCGAMAGRWYLADADATCSSSTAGMVGVAPSNIASAGSGSIRLQGRITGLSALSAGEKYYVSATAGALTATPPTNTRFIAAADSTTSIVVGGIPGSVLLPDSNGTHDLVIRTTSDLTADRLLTIVPGDAARTVTLGGNLTTSANVTTTGAGNLTIAAGAADRTLTITASTSIPATIQPGLTAVRVYTANDTWTKPAGLHSIVVWVVGSGGGGAGSATTAGGEGSCGGGGGAGGAAMERLLEAALGATETVTVGAAGAAGAVAAAGGNGNTTSFGALLSATGGAGGSSVGAAAVARGADGGLPGVGSGGDANFGGQGGFACLVAGAANGGHGGNGGSSILGGGGTGLGGQVGRAGSAYGSGGSGAANFQSETQRVGGAGAAGVVIVYEYSN